MSYQFKLDVEKTIVEVEFKGIVDFSERKKAINEGVLVLQDREYPRILVNLVDAQMQLSKVEKADLVNYVSTQPALFEAKTAFLIHNEQTEQNAIDNAIVRPDDFDAHVFYSRTQAIEWLSN